MGNASGLALREANVMRVILREAFAALALLAFIVWWTMFPGRRGDERADDDDGR